MVANEKSYVAVGSNNNNDNHYEKAKISKYTLKKEKVFEKLYNVGYNSAFFGVVADDNNYVAVGSYEKNIEDQAGELLEARCGGRGEPSPCGLGTDGRP